jgi:hypothetical protein
MSPPSSRGGWSLSAANNERLLKLGAKLEIASQDSKQKGVERAHCDTLKPVEEGTAAARTSRALERILLGCGNALSRENATRLLDVDSPGALTSQLAIAGAIARILGDNPEGELSLDRASDVAVANVLELDPAAFEAQLPSTVSASA